MLLLVPCDPLRPRRADEHFVPEVNAAKDLGIEVAVVDHDVLAGSGDPAQAVAGVPEAADAVYRGWMLRSEQYQAFETALAARGVRLRTDAGQYRRAHELPGWYPALSAVTPASVWTVGTDQAEIAQMRAALGSGPAVLRDYVKSMKHYWDQASFIPDVADAETARKVINRFLELREDAFVGGLVFRRYEHFRGAEARTWWVRGRCVLISAHPDTPDQTPPADLDVSALAPLVAELRLPFVSLDLAARDDGAWRVIELGDGQVSDRPTTLEPRRLLHALI